MMPPSQQTKDYSIKNIFRVPVMHGTVEMNLTRNHEVAGSIPWPRSAQQVKDPVWLWLWYRPVATALIRRLACEPLYAVEAALEMSKKTNKIKFFYL